MSKQLLPQISNTKEQLKHSTVSSTALDVKDAISSHRIRKKRHTKRITHEISQAEAPRKHSFDIQGVGTLILSTMTQKIVGCIVGEHVTAENPWTYVRKELIQDNIDLHEGSSEFLSIGNEIQAYPEEEILIGWIPAASEKHDEFHIIYTIDAKEEVLKVIERQKKEMKKKLQRMVSRSTGVWNSLGKNPMSLRLL